MNYNNNPALINALASQYVLGTLRGKARDRFETLKFANENIQQAVTYWEDRLHPLSFELAPIEPRAEVWEQIQRAVKRDQSTSVDDTEKASNVVSIGDKSKPEKTTPSNSTNWKWVSSFALAACLVLAILFVPTQVQQFDRLESVAVINNEDNKTLWSFDILENEIAVKTTSFVPRLSNNDYQLWIVPASGDAPISIGVMEQSGEFRLDKPEIYNNIEVAALAVSREPLGGSPTGSPTVVLYAAEIALL